jgi:ribosomal-protein-serine acetyltransferase
MADPRIEIDDQLALRAWQLEDAPQLFELVTANRGHLAAWFDWVDGYTSMDRPRRFVELARAAYADGTGLDLALTLNGELAGAAGFVRLDRRGGCGELGYWLAKPHQGRGLMTLACDALLEHASRELGLSHFVIRAATENVRSRAVAERLGFALLALRARADPPARARSGDEAFYVLSRSSVRA